jgi:hypothetical protein
MITHTVQANNVIKWIDSLKDFKKGVNTLGSNEPDEDDNGDYPTKYCCLGVACRVFDIEPQNGWSWGIEVSLLDKLGLHTYEGTFMDPQTNKKVLVKGMDSLTRMNDNLFGKDETFTRVEDFILEHLEVIFIPPVVEKLIEYYGE